MVMEKSKTELKRERLERIIYCLAGLLFLAVIVLVGLKLADVVKIDFWSCLMPVTVPSLAIGFCFFLYVLLSGFVALSEPIERLLEKIR